MPFPRPILISALSLCLLFPVLARTEQTPFAQETYLALPLPPGSLPPPPQTRLEVVQSAEDHHASPPKLLWQQIVIARIPQEQAAPFQAAAHHQAEIRSIPPRCSTPDRLWLAIRWPPDPPGVSPRHPPHQ